MTTEVRKAKANYYKQRFDEVQNVKSYWKLVNKSSSCSKSTPIAAIRREDTTLATDDHEKATILNDHFSTVGEKLAEELPKRSTENTTTISNNQELLKPHIVVTNQAIHSQISSLKSNKAKGPDNISPKLLKLADETIVPSLTDICHISAKTCSVPKSWKTGKITPIFKKDKEEEKSNYRPISLLCIPSKIMETAVADTLTLHMTINNLFNPFQWAYKKGLSSELLLMNMTEQWRLALDSNNVVCAVFF